MQILAGPWRDSGFMSEGHGLHVTDFPRGVTRSIGVGRSKVSAYCHLGGGGRGVRGRDGEK